MTPKMRNFVIIHSSMLLLLILVTMHQVNGKRILAILPAPSYSHQSVYRPLCLALNKRGYEMVVATTHPMNDPTLTNYKEIDLSSMYKVMADLNIRQYLKQRAFLSLAEFENAIHPVINNIMMHTANHPQIRKLYSAGNNEKFDAIILESLMGPGLYALLNQLNAPLIGIQSVDPHAYHHFDFGNQILPSHPSNWEYAGSTGFNLPFWTRVQNFINTYSSVYRWQKNVVAEQDRYVRAILGNDLPPINEFAQNLSIYLVNHDPAIGYARPIHPNTVLFNGFHIMKKPPPLPKSLKKFLDSATNGFIYLSLGTNANTTDLPPSMMQAFFNVFAKLPYKILWKLDHEEYMNKLDNVYMAKWIPQQSVLAHPNIKLFIYQGGLQSTEETVHYGVPVIGLPLVFDQQYRVEKLASVGVGRQLNILRITEEVIYEAIDDIVNNKRYKEKMVELSALVKDKPYNSMEHVIWWIEYVIRHKGAPHLRYSEMEQPWYRRHDVDIIAFLAIILFSVIVLSVIVLIKIVLWSIENFNGRSFDILQFYLPSSQKNTKTE